MPENNTITTPFRIRIDDPISSQRKKTIAALLDNYGLVSSTLTDSSLQGLTLVIRETEICLVDPLLDERAGVTINFIGGAADHRRRYGGGKSQTLAKAIGLDQTKGLDVVDATAGLAGDSFVMACLGANVLVLERNPVLSLMIAEALNTATEYAAHNDDSLATIIDQMQLMHIDATVWLDQQKEASRGVVYLDPMFPERKKKAAVKKEMQLLQSLLPTDTTLLETEESELLEQARRVSRFRTVVKRPRHAPPLAGDKPGYSLEGKSTRFDIYPKRAISQAVR
jgi:16S rRNA (guanine1516-N2)-methyltransferase